MSPLSQQWVAPLLLVSAVLSFLLGEGIAGHGGGIGGLTIQGRLVDVIYLASYLLLFLGALCLPTPRLTHSSKRRIVVDAMMIVVALSSFVWYFITGPSLLAVHLPNDVRLTRGGYALFDLALVGLFLLLTVHHRDRALRPVLALLGLGLGMLVGADLVTSYQTVHQAIAPSVVLDLLRPAGFTLAVAALGIGLRGTRGGATTPAASLNQVMPATPMAGLPTVWQYLLPYALIPAVVAIMIYAARTPHDTYLEPMLYVLGAVLIELVFVHQFLAYRDLIAYTHRSARLETLAAADPITTVPNHRTIVTTLDQELDRCRRYGHPCSVLFLDLDHFKALNDTFGHRAGDSALREFAATVRAALRHSDILGRWGGEEFVALLPETELDVALSVAERVRASVAGHPFHAASGRSITCSVGLASFPLHARDRDGLVEMADQAMYAAKRGGRNQVRVAGVAPDPAGTEAVEYA